MSDSCPHPDWQCAQDCQCTDGHDLLPRWNSNGNYNLCAAMRQAELMPKPKGEAG